MPYYPPASGNNGVANDPLWNNKGDLAVGTGSDTATSLGVGTNGYVLTADSAQSTGVKWAAASSSGHTIQDEGVDQTTRAKLNFVGSSVTVTDDSINGATVVTVTGGSISTDTIWDTKGDLAVATGADTAAKLPVGTNGQVLVADSTQTTGLKWDTNTVADPPTVQIIARQNFK